MLARAKHPHAISIQFLRSIEAIADIPHRFDDVVPEFGPQVSDRDVDHVAPGVEGDAPDLLEELRSATDVPSLPHQVFEERELSLRDGGGPPPRIGHPAYHVEGHVPPPHVP